MEKGVSIIIPAYNSEHTVNELYERTRRVLDNLKYPSEFIFVNGSSRDRTWEVILDLVGSSDNVRGISLMKNYGQHNAILCGIRAAKYDTIVTMDDDLQHPPEAIPYLLMKLNEGFDVVYGTPERGQHGLWRNVASKITKMVLQKAMGAEIALKVCALRAFRTQLREAFMHYNCPFVSIDVLLTWATSRFTAITVEHENRKFGSSNYTIMKLISHTFNMMTGFSVLPLQCACFLGFACTFIGILSLAYVIAAYMIFGRVVQGFTFLASIISIFSGVQLFTLGIFGEYLIRIHFRTMEKPPYVIAETSFDDEKRGY